MSSPSYGGAAAARGKLLNARGSSNPLVTTTLPKRVPKAQTIIGSQSYNYVIPILSIPGRAGLDLNLNLYYNSRIWDIDNVNNTVTFNADRDFPSYGFRLDFGYVEKTGTGTNISYIVTENDGTKHQLALGSTGTYDAADGTFISFDATAKALYYKNGTILYYEGFPSQGSSPTLFRPTQIRDTNGNSIFFAYLAGHDDLLQYIVDTGDRIFAFNYDAGGELQNIAESLRPSGIQTYATFTWAGLYGTGASWYNFTGLTVNGAPSLTTALNVVTACTYANGTGYRFTYGDWGIITKIENLSASGSTRSYVNYNYPLASAGALSDAPFFTQETYSPDGGSSNISSWNYSVTKSGTGVVTSMTVTDPLAQLSDPSGSIVASNLNSSTGLLSSIQTKNGVNAVLRTVNYTWGSSGSAPVPITIATTNDAGQTSSIQYAYDANYGNVTDMYEYDFGSVLKRHTVTAYPTAFQPYLANHVLNLVTQILVKDGSGNTIARTDMAYDGGTPVAVTGLDTHDDAGHGPAFPARGNLTSVTRYSNASAGTGAITRSFAYNTLGNILTAQLDCCNSKTFNYSLTTQYNYPDSVVRGPSGGPQFTSSFSYNNDTGLAISSIDENGQTTQYQYDVMNRTTAILLPPQGTTVVQQNTAFDDYAVPATVKNYTTNSGNTAQTITTYDGLGHVTEVDVKDGATLVRTTTTAYDKIWRPTQVSNPFAPGETPIHYTTFTYDGLGRMIQTSPPSAGYTQYAYSGNTVVVTDPAGKQRKNYSDALGRLTEVDEPGWGDAKPGSASFTVSGFERSIQTDPCYDPDDLHPRQCPRTTWDSGTVYITANGHTDSTTYNSSDGTTSIATNLAHAINIDASASVTAGVSGAIITLTAKTGGASTNYSVSSTSTSGDPTDFGTAGSFVASSGSLTGGVDGTPEGSPTLARPIVTTYAYDVFDNITSASVAATGPVGGVTYSGQPRTYAYDSLSRLTSASTPESGTITSYYTTVSGAVCSSDPTKICRVQDARGIVKTLTYDGINRPLTVTYSDGTPTVTYAYDVGGSGAFALDRLTSITEGSNSQTLTYDNLGRIQSADQTIDSVNYPLQYAYNLLGQFATVIYPSGRVVSETYNNVGQIASIASGGTNYLSGTSYTAAGQISGFTMGNGIQGAFTYNDHLQLATLHYFTSGLTPDPLNLSYDYTSTAQPNNNGQIQAVHYFTQLGEDQTKSELFSYDSWFRLKAAQTSTVDASIPGTWSLIWSYDRLGNRKQQTLVGGNLPNGIGQPNLMIDETTNRISGLGYDSAGNLTNDGTNAYAYDGANRLKNINTTSAVYTYAGPLRIKKVLGSTTIQYVYSGSRPIAEYVNGSLSREYIYAGSRLLSSVTSSSTAYYHSDHLSNRVQTDSSGNIIRSMGNFPYGESWYDNTPQDKWKFTSYERDLETGETGLDYAQFRHYNSGLGRFVQVDLLAGRRAIPQSLNRYAYVLNDPINLTDLQGLSDGGGGGPCLTGFVWNGHECVPYPGGGNGGGGQHSPLQENGTGGGGGNSGKVNIKALLDCIFSIYGILGYDFQQASSPGTGHGADNTNGSFSGVGPDRFSGKEPISGFPGFNDITVTTDFKSKDFTATNAANGSSIYSQPGTGSVEGYTNAKDPYTNFIANGLVDPVNILAVQIWELGNALYVITGGPVSSGMIATDKDDPGSKLLDCYNKQAGTHVSP
jgi:RHS repeat-associated protein